MSAQHYADTVLYTAQVIGVSLSMVSRKDVALTAAKLQAFRERSLEVSQPCAIVLDTIHRGGEAFLMVMGFDPHSETMALGFS